MQLSQHDSPQPCNGASFCYCYKVISIKHTWLTLFHLQHHVQYNNCQDSKEDDNDYHQHCCYSLKCCQRHSIICMYSRVQWAINFDYIYLYCNTAYIARNIKLVVIKFGGWIPYRQCKILVYLIWPIELHTIFSLYSQEGW